jgi:hypothetical protein
LVFWRAAAKQLLKLRSNLSDDRILRLHTQSLKDQGDLPKRVEKRPFSDGSL